MSASLLFRLICPMLVLLVCAVPVLAVDDAAIAAARSTWAWGLPKDHPVPAVKDSSWGTSPIDRFILARLEAQGLKPAPPADRRS